ncbi:hypothetical protein GGTG_04633 [Gaeumannomyces tritici R3-111a-1]|uniref:Uncharacterized protein n=1 Tax=Gaeumannomyces tritici (strain R3-111a-1) TaxID=644352 RepID=J3NTN3_GAET3|nr:hypothetical protein GGTG_04633 [Gaeumannomyces tritici R3-111a-1]EJT79548.1 hypothetical protein GGTG_04633 [Gaeumannomyces tritici R3-111a-1]
MSREQAGCKRRSSFSVCFAICLVGQAWGLVGERVNIIPCIFFSGGPAAARVHVLVWSGLVIQPVRPVLQRNSGSRHVRSPAVPPLGRYFPDSLVGGLAVSSWSLLHWGDAREQRGIPTAKYGGVRQKFSPWGM